MTHRKKPKTESPEAAQAFEHYYSQHALGEDCTLKDVAAWLWRKREGEKSVSEPERVKAIMNLTKTVGTWSSAFAWRKRVIDRDSREAAKKRRAQLKTIEKMNEEHAQIGQAAALMALEELNRLRELDKIGSMAAVRLLEVGLQTQRLAVGAATEHVLAEVTGKDGEPLEGQVGIYKVMLPQKKPVE